MKPFYPFGTPCKKPTCGSCDKCHKSPCACPEPVMGIDKVAGEAAIYRFNWNGKTTVWDFAPGIHEAETDTSLVTDIVDRLLIFSAERHTDTITASELGAILRLNDLGDVSTKDAQNGAMLVFKKSDLCGPGCYSPYNIWEPWNALDNQTTSAAYASAFDADGLPVALQQPRYPNQYYNLAWNGNDQLSYQQPPEETAPIPDGSGYAYQMYLNPTTKQPYYVKVKV